MFETTPALSDPAPADTRPDSNAALSELLARNAALAKYNQQLILELSQFRALGISGAAPLPALTRRQQQIMDHVLAGRPNKAIAADLKISQRTVENHRAAIMRRTGATSLAGLVRLSLAAAAPR